VYDETNYKTCITAGKHLHAASSTENPRKTLLDMAWPGGQKFSG